MSKAFRYVVAALLLVFVGLQFVQPVRTNPPSNPDAAFERVAKPPVATAAVVGRACRDCHSHETRWPWYSKVSPVSWLVAADVREARLRLNLSQWNVYSPKMSRLRLMEMCAVAQAGKMPPRQYTLIHSDARLTPEDVKALCAAPAK